MTISASSIKIKDSTIYRSLLDIFYPVGSVYISTVNTNPASFLGGTWVAISSENAVLRASTTYGLTGSDTCTLTVNQIPSHQHQLNDWAYVVAKNAAAIPVLGPSRNANPSVVVPQTSNYQHNKEIKYNYATGGGLHTVLFNVLSTVLCEDGCLTNQEGDALWL